MVASSCSYSCFLSIRHSHGVGSSTKSFPLLVLHFCSRDIFVSSGIWSTHAWACTDHPWGIQNSSQTRKPWAGISWAAAVGLNQEWAALSVAMWGRRQGKWSVRKLIQIKRVGFRGASTRRKGWECLNYNIWKKKSCNSTESALTMRRVY